VDSIYKSALNRDVAPARPGEVSPLRLGPLVVFPPVVLAPMAGVTNYPFRALCRRFGAGLYVSEMITARPLVEGRDKTLRLADFGPDESPRSLQLYGVDPYFVSEAVKRLVNEGRVDHIDMNFGCPVRKVTRKGGGAAIPVKPNLLRAIVRAAVKAAERVPVTIKLRLGIDDRLLTFHTAGKIAEEEGCAAVGLHARTASQLYDGEARWSAIGELKAAVSIPVLGNGDIWEAEQSPPNLGEVVDIMLEHARRWCDWTGERHAMRAFRRHATWYTKGFRGSAALRARIMQVSSYDDLARALADVDRAEPFPPSAMRVARGKASGTQQVSLPDGYLDDLADASPPPAEAEDAFSGG
jgi:tRNA-dihydrouridine synthase